MDLAAGLILLLIGIFAGGYGTIVGAGGGFIFVPALLLLMNVEPAVAAGSGLVIVLINAISGAMGYARQKKIQYAVGVKIAAGAIPGSLAGVWILQMYSSSYFYIVFATVLVGLGTFLLIKNSKKRAETAATAEALSAGQYTAAKLVPVGILMGILSSYLGIGGGFLLVPILIYLFKMPTYAATATSIFSLTLYTSSGAIMQMYLGNIDWSIVVWGGVGVLLGSQLGVLLSRKISARGIIQMLAILLIVIGFRLYFQ
ncbi:sulfite exporter TauE/SafE family protein [Bacillaceae bacterium SIJ1]|uniref:sulfite exporter TauE/SafE family protein n=1 Tax=Litoribacterium kuwaitense TaxID=1398745 RepID=UPI0013EC3851|nr:sulfite exporter TauE/SafE family protein [Litoribacterium kuwaitense]NGP45750.1 sulfite exporter TauE/SafE family protein [Litoribacterium kuwaitense]